MQLAVHTVQQFHAAGIFSSVRAPLLFFFKCHALMTDTMGTVRITPIVDEIPCITSIPIEYIFVICVAEYP